MHKIVINEEGINSIIFEATAPQDAGNYLCIARNRAGEDRFNVALNVLREWLVVGVVVCLLWYGCVVVWTL